MMLILILAAASGPTPGALKTYQDWTVGCDNGRACQAVALVPEAGDRDGYLLLVIKRDGAAGAQPDLHIPLPDNTASGMSFSLRVDGKPVARITGAGGDEATLPFDRALASALANGRQVSLARASGKPVASASLAGLAAALLYIDDQQRRIGTNSALRRAGAAVAPAPPPLPVIVQPPLSPKPPRTLNVAAATRLIGPGNATCEYANSPVKPEAARLDAAHSVVTIDHPCGNGAYNLFTSVFVIDEGGRATPAVFDTPSGMSEDSDELVNGGWDAKSRRLSSFTKARGIGDCGGSQSFAWDGARFRLVEQRSMEECRGSVDYITTWRARVVSR